MEPLALLPAANALNDSPVRVHPEWTPASNACFSASLAVMK
jgi:hypothetical protein